MMKLYQISFSLLLEYIVHSLVIIAWNKKNQVLRIKFQDQYQWVEVKFNPILKM